MHGELNRVLLGLTLGVLVVGCADQKPTAASVGASQHALMATDDAGVFNTSVILNEYAAMTFDVAAGATSIRVADVTTLDSVLYGPLAAGDLLMIIQMQGADIDTTDTSTYGAVTDLHNAGLYEFIEVASVTLATNTIGLRNGCGGLKNPYTAAAHTQVIRVPQFSSLTINSAGNVTAPPWNGSTGGVVALHVRNTMTLSGTVDVRGLGFRGGEVDDVSDAGVGTLLYRSQAMEAGGEKGEGIAGSQASYDSRGGRYGRGAAANGGGGGNAHRAGGGGGANALAPAAVATGWQGQGVMDSTLIGGTAWSVDPSRALGTQLSGLANNPGGGRGGYSYSLNNQNATGTAPGNAAWGGNLRREVGGLGGRPLSPDALTRLFLGGGGGAGDGNTTTSGAGGRGGGLIYVIADTVTGTGALVANGSVGGDTSDPHVDAAGGGGAGGTVVVRANALSGFSIAADGASGGKQKLAAGQDPASGPGGGGSGGFIAVVGGTPTRSAAGGLGGDTSSNGLTEFPANGATRGAAGNAAAGVPVATATAVNDVPVCLEPADLSVTIDNGATVSTPGEVTTFTITVRNLGPNTATRARLLYTIPAQFVTSASTPTWSCTSATSGCVAPSGIGSISSQFFTLPAGGVATYTVTATIRPDAVGTMTNTAVVFSPSIINDTVATNNVSVDTDALGPVADLNLTASVTTPAPVVEDGPITWVIDVTNFGPSQAGTLVTTVFQLPPATDVAFVSATGTGWTCSRAGVIVTCTRPNLAVNMVTPQLITITGTVLLAGGALPWSTSVSTNEPATNSAHDPNTANNSLSTSTVVEAVNDSPINTVPGAQTTPEDVAKVFSIANGNAISVDDVDIGANEFEISLDSVGGAAPTMTIGSTAGLTFSTGTGTNDQRMVFRGLKGAVNSALNGLSYKASPNFNGPGRITLITSDLGATGSGGVKTAASQINITVSPVNDPPTLLDDDFAVNEDAPTLIDVLLNDSAFPDTAETLSVIDFPEPPMHGTVQGGGTMPLTYTSSLNYSGPDTFTYTVSDGTTGSSSTARVTITVLPVNDPPTAVNDSNVGVPQDSTNTFIDVLANDSSLPDTNPETISVQSVSQPSHGSTSVSSGGVRYTPAPGYSGPDSFTYTITDGSLTSTATVTVTVGPANKPPVNAVPGAQLIEEDTTLTFSTASGKAISISDEDAALSVIQVTIVATNGLFTLGGSLIPLSFAVGDGTNDATMTFTAAIADINEALASSVFTPTANFNGAATLQIVSNDLGNTGVGGAKTDVDTITITVSPVNDQPFANNDTVTVAEDTAAERIEPLGNDNAAPDTGETLRIIDVSTAMHGTVMLIPGGERIAYTPEANFYGSDSFTYTITDGNGGLATATINVNVLNVNDPPTATPDIFSLTQDSTENFLDVLANDSYLPDPSETLSVVVVSPVSHGTLIISTDGSGVVYTPTAGYVGPDGFTYTVRDSNGGFAASIVTLTIGADTDRDGLSDDDEHGYGTNPLDADTDDDGLSDGVEVLIGKTNPLDDDTDDDGLLDGNEDANHNGVHDANETDNKITDTDGDQLLDGLEKGLTMPQGKNTKLTVFRADADPTTQTNPLRPDTDGGGDYDYVEDQNLNGRIDTGETDPNNPLDDRKDFDNDGLTDAKEIATGLDPNDADTDDDGVVDGTDGLVDTDGDGLIDAIDVDSDNDGILDGTESGVTDDLKPRDTDLSKAHFVPDLDPSTRTNPKAAESDGDGLKDGDEDRDHNGRHDAGETDASKADTDDDGLSDGLELKAANPTDPEVADTDSDGLLDGEEDTDADGKIDSDETDPNIADTDGGGANDGAEVKRHTDPLNKIDDYEARGGGGGCASVPGTWALLGVALLVMRRRRLSMALVVLLVLTGGLGAASSKAFAQNLYNTAIDVQRFKPGVGSQDFLNIESAKVAPHLTPFAGLYIGYANQPLVLGAPGTNQTEIALVNDLTFFDLSVGLALKDHLELSLALPLSIAKGQLADNLDASLGTTHNGFAAGDLRFVPKYSFFAQDRPLQVGVSLPLAFPTGGAKNFRGGGAVMVSPRALVELNLPIFRLAANVGFNLRTAEMRLMNITVGQEFTWGLGGEFPLFGKAGENALVLQAALTGAVGLRKLTGTTVPVDILAGLKYRIGNVMAFELAGGAGLTHGWASPKYQVVFGFSYQHAPIQLPESWFKKDEPPEVIDDARFSKPGAGNPDDQFVTRNPDAAVAKPPPVAIEAPIVDNTPKFADADRDGVSDANDKCAGEKETINGIADDDGCPDKGDIKVSIANNKLTFKGKIEFQGKRAALTSNGESLVRQLAAVLRANPDARLRIDVFVTEMNSLDDNNQMSAQRAAALREMLIKEGIERKRLLTRALGMQKPLEPSMVELMLL